MPLVEPGLRAFPQGQFKLKQLRTFFRTFGTGGDEKLFALVPNRSDSESHCWETLLRYQVHMGK